MNTMQDQLKTIREACIKANPSILDLMFGCELKRNNQYGSLYKCVNEHGFAYSDEKIWLNSVPFGTMEVEKSRIGKGLDFEIIGRKIGIADVLAALKENGIREYQIIEIIKSYYNLLDDDITNQSPECVAFIYELLK